eukprot:g1768.t1
MVTITTTGYGDLQPNSKFCNNGTMLFTCLYAMIGTGMIASMMGFTLSLLLEEQERKAGKRKLQSSMRSMTRSSRKHGMLEDVTWDKLTSPTWLCCTMWSSLSMCNPLNSERIPEDIRAPLKNFVYWLVLKVVVIAYFCVGDKRPVEFDGPPPPGQPPPPPPPDKPLSTVDAVYMVSVSFTSVGYGDFSPQSQAARFFAVFWLLFGLLLTGEAFVSFATSFLTNYQRKLDLKNLKGEFSTRKIMRIDRDHSGTVSEVEFVAHYLETMKIVDPLSLADLRQRFKELDKDHDGEIDEDDLRIAHDQAVKAHELAIKAEALSRSRGMWHSSRKPSKKKKNSLQLEIEQAAQEGLPQVATPPAQKGVAGADGQKKQSAANVVEQPRSGDGGQQEQPKEAAGGERKEKEKEKEETAGAAGPAAEEKEGNTEPVEASSDAKEEQSGGGGGAETAEAGASDANADAAAPRYL